MSGSESFAVMAKWLDDKLPADDWLQPCTCLLTSGSAEAAMNETNAKFKWKNRCWGLGQAATIAASSFNTLLLLQSELFKITRKLYAFGAVSLSWVIFNTKHNFTC